MSNKIVAVVLMILVFAFPFRWAFLSENVSHITGLIGFLITLAAFFVIVLLLNKGDKEVVGH